ncbi:MAG: HD domain-containing protein [Nanoarchaeota archaeon]
MLIKDKVYGNEEIKDPVIIDLINSKTLQRLKLISQQGMPREYYHRDVFSRFDHSCGVLILLRRLGASTEEQIAGLLHDASHTAFSHVIDWVIGDPSKEDYQDNMLLDFLKKSDIPPILKKYNIKIESIANLTQFTLLEKEIPSLCADRVDYTLRELAGLGYNPKFLVNSIISVNGQIAFKTKEAAKQFGLNYSKLQKEHWSGNEAKARYHILAETLKYALHKKHISLQELHTTDYEVLNKLIKTNDTKILQSLNKLKGSLIINESKTGGILLKKKFRYIDPEVFIKGKLINLSHISAEYKNMIEEEKQSSNHLARVEIS